MSLFKTMTVIGLLASLTNPVFAQDPSPVGTWQTTTGESRYTVSLCGDGTQLCAKLTWLRADARTPENLELLNQYVVRNAKSTAQNKWLGTVHYDGKLVSGSVTLVSNSKMRLSGCKFVACQSVDFIKL